MTQPNQSARGESHCSGSQGGSAGTTRRGFLKVSGVVGLSVVGGPIVAEAFGHASRERPLEWLIPTDKKLDPVWVKSLFAKGTRKVYRDEELKTIGMPVGGVAAGQVYLTGDGRLACWDVFNHPPEARPGNTRYAALSPAFPLEQGFAVRVNGVERTLDRSGFSDVTFTGEYPMAWVTYDAADFPVRVVMEAFSPFIPLNAADSALPATVLRFRIENKSDAEVKAEIVGWLENAVARSSKDCHSGWRVNHVTRSALATTLACAVEGRPEDDQASSRPAIIVEDVEFEIERPFINLLISGGAAHPKIARVNLVVDGQVVRTSMGRNGERVDWQTWGVKSLIGRRGRIEIHNAASGPWSQVHVGMIEMSDRPANGTAALSTEPDVGTMSLSLLGQGIGRACRDVDVDVARVDIQAPLVGEIAREMSIAGGGFAEATFVVAWHFPNRARHGQYYANRFHDAPAVAEYVAGQFDRLSTQTRLWHATYYDSSLPHWFLDRVHMPIANLATGTCQWWGNGRLWAWEGAGIGHGTCTHVWNYAQGLAHLFPELERSAREAQDFGAAFNEDGLVGFRGGREYAADGQAGTVLKAYREHLLSKDDAFLRRNWPRVKRAIEFLIARDTDGNGLIEEPQHNTYDVWFHGPNTYVGALYLAALRASEEMATRMGDASFASKCRHIVEAGAQWSDRHLFDGEYYCQKVDLDRYPDQQYACGCLADQLFGQNWAAQLGLGYIYKPENVRAALKAVYKYNWMPDVRPHSEQHPTDRLFANAGQAGLINCTFPKSEYLGSGVLHRDEVWTGVEYQVASHMIREGMLEEAFSIIRGIHERYDGATHNPWNEIEAGEHAARSLASWGCLTAVSGYEYDGPAGKLAFAPKLTPNDFKCAFTAADGWGTFAQDKQGASVRLKWGQLRLSQFSVAIPASGKVTVNGRPLHAVTSVSGSRTAYTFDPITLHAGDELTVWRA